MDIRFNKTNPRHGIISITLHEPDYRPVVDQQIRHYAKNVRLKGFRLGAVPINLVKRMHEPSILAEELPKLASKALENYTTQEAIPLFMEPLFMPSNEPLDFTSQADFTFSYEVSLLEDLPIELGTHMSVTKFKVDGVGDKPVDEFIEALQIVHGTSEDLEESDEDAILYGHFKGAVDEVDLDLRISVAHIPEDLRKPFIGLRVDQTVVLSEEIFLSHSYALLDINTGAYSQLKKNKAAWPGLFTISKVVHVTPAPITPQLFDLVLGEGTADSEAAFREKIGRIILFDKHAEAQYLFYKDLCDEILKYISVELPDTFLKKWLLVHNPEATVDQIEEYYEKSAKKIKWEILLGAVIKKNSLTVIHSDVLDEAKRIYLDTTQKFDDNFENQLPESDIDAMIVSLLKQDKGKPYMKLHERLSRSRAMNFIEKHISVVLQEVTTEQFDAR
ncbi:trigger factor family protein [Cardinium endosymbiont of Tipula unca]|uniref:trigger factor family protein n=1 Tax=Cardinium endosymbiont of Tipula unca TaxID=3066216 RepID=UPI0030CB178F